MSISLSRTRQARASEAPPGGGLVRFNGAGDEGQPMVLRLVGEGKRVLALGGSPALLAELREQECEVVDVPTASADGGLDLPETSAAGGFDVIVAFDVLEHLRDPVAVLQTARQHLRREGYVVAAAPNVGHGTVRLALLAGASPLGEDELGHAPRRFFTYESLIGLVEKAGFAIGSVQRQEEEVNLPDGVPDSAADLLDTVSQAPEARTSRFVVVAYPLPWPGLDWLQERLRSLSEQYATARRESDCLKEDLEGVSGHVHLLLEQQQAALTREKDLRARILDAHDLLLQRDEQVRVLQQTLHAQEEHLAVCRHTIRNLEARLLWFHRTPLGLAYRVLRRVKRALVRS